MLNAIKAFFRKFQTNHSHYRELSDTQVVEHLEEPEIPSPSPKKFICLLHASLEYGMPCDSESIGVGGIGTLVSSLCIAQQQYKNIIDARVIIPYYPELHKHALFIESVRIIYHFYDDRIVSSLISKTTTREGVIQYLVKPLSRPFSQLFKDILTPEMIYSDVPNHSTLLERMSYFSSAVSAFSCVGEPSFKPNIVQGHGWGLSLLGKLIKKQRLNNLSISEKRPHTIYTCHSSHDSFPSPEELKIAVFRKKQINVTQEVLENGYDHIVYVSESLLKGSILHLNYGSISKFVLQAYNADKISMILNNVLADQFNPAQCLSDEFKFDLNDISSGKMNLKIHLNNEVLRHLWKKINLNAPMLLYVGRYMPEKGIETFDSAIKIVLQNGGTFFAMGIGEPDFIKNLIYRYRNDPSIIFFTTKEEQSLYGKWVRAAADIYLVPSREEACGLVPMEAGISGAPVVSSSAGGLKNVVIPEANGARFADNEDFSEVLQNTLTSFSQLKETGNLNTALRLIQESATKTFDWHSSTAGSIAAYFDLYQCLLNETKPSKTFSLNLSEYELKEHCEYLENLQKYKLENYNLIGNSTAVNHVKFLQHAIQKFDIQIFYEFLETLNQQGHRLSDVINFRLEPSMCTTAVHAAALCAQQTGNVEMLLQLILLGGNTSWEKGFYLRGYDYLNYANCYVTVDDIIGPKMCAGVKKLSALALNDQIHEHCHVDIKWRTAKIILDYCEDTSVTSWSVKHLEYNFGISYSVNWLQQLHNNQAGNLENLSQNTEALEFMTQPPSAARPTNLF